MSCGHTDAPFLTRAELLRSLFDPAEEDDDEDAAFLDWFLRLRSSGMELLLCPDVMLATYGGGRGAHGVKEASWARLAQRHRFQAVVTDFKPRVEHAFTCQQVIAAVNSSTYVTYIQYTLMYTYRL